MDEVENSCGREVTKLMFAAEQGAIWVAGRMGKVTRPQNIEGRELRASLTGDGGMWELVLLSIWTKDALAQWPPLN